MRRVICCADAMDPQIDTSSGEPSRVAIDALDRPDAARVRQRLVRSLPRRPPVIANALKAHPGVRHVKVEDGSGQPLGRSYGVKLWPTLVFLADGREAARLVRPRDAAAIDEALERIAPVA
jgi:thioredoxin 1